MTLLEELQEQGIVLEAAGDRLKFRGPAEVLTPTLRQRIAEHKAELLAHLRQQQSAQADPTAARAETRHPVSPVLALPAPADAAQDLEETIRFARSEHELEAALDSIQPALDAGRLSREQGERLTWLACDVARQLDAGLVNVPASAFLDGQTASNCCAGATISPGRTTGRWPA